MSSSSEECIDEVSKLESKVVLALSRLQKGNKQLKKQGKTSGVKKNQVVDYLSAHYCYLDGDLETQVMTALLSCVKSGIVCALDNGKFRLVGPSSKAMVSNCLTRSSHGPQCSCLFMINSLSKDLKKFCCFLKAGRRIREFRRAPKGKGITKAKLTAAERGKTNGQKAPRKPRKKCIQKEQEKLSSAGSTEASTTSTTLRKSQERCDYCLEIHPPPGKKQGKEKSPPCSKCYPPGTRYGVPYDKFSPREEVM